MDPISAVAAWLLKTFASVAADRAAVHLTAFVLGEPLQAALVQPTSDALAIAVAEQLGDDAAQEKVQRAFDVLSAIWTGDFALYCDGETLLNQMRSLVARAIEAANAPVMDLGAEYAGTTSLTALSDELGVVFDGAELAKSFGIAWVRAVEYRSISDATLSQLALLLSNEETQEIASEVLAAQERAARMLDRATQALHDARGEVALWDIRERWFRTQIVPVDEMMLVVYNDYVDGFTAAARAVRGGTDSDLDAVIAVLNDLRRGQSASHTSVQRVTKVLARERDRSPFDVEVQAKFTGLWTGVDRFIHGADERLYESWYAYYIRQFEALKGRGDDPLERTNYAIAGAHDLRPPLAIQLQLVADQDLPAKYGEYVDAFAELKTFCLSG